MRKFPLALAAAVLLMLFLPAADARAEEDSDDEMLDLGSLGSFEAAPSEKPAESGGFGGGNAIFSGRILTKAAHDLRRDNDEEFLFSDLTYASAKAAVTLTPKVAFTLEGLFEYCFETDWDDTQGQYDIYLWEGNARFKLGPVDLTLGQQHVTWGLVDIINPTSLINPPNFDRLLDFELGYGKLPAPMVRTEIYMPADFKLDLVVLPFFIPAKFNIIGQDVALLAHNFPLFMLMAQLRENDHWYQVERALDHWYPGWDEDLDALLSDQDFYDNRTQYLDDDFTHAEGALRLSGHQRAWDYSVSYMYLWDDIPTLHLNPAFTDLLGSFSQNENGYTPIPNPDDIELDTILEPFAITYHRTHTIGADLGTSVNGVGLRAEGTYAFARYTYTNELDAERKPIVTAVFNIDYLFEHDVLISFIYMSMSMLNYSNDMMAPPTYALPFLVFRKPWLDDKLTTELVATYDFSFVEKEDWEDFDIFHEDGMVSPMITYAITDPFKISVGANFLWGDRFHLLGILRDETRVFTTLKYDF